MLSSAVDGHHRSCAASSIAGLTFADDSSTLCVDRKKDTRGIDNLDNFCRDVTLPRRYSLKVITKNPADWQAGYMAAMSDHVPEYPLKCGDRLAFWAGYVEGRAARRRAAQAYIERGGRPHKLG